MACYSAIPGPNITAFTAEVITDCGLIYLMRCNMGNEVKIPSRMGPRRRQRVEQQGTERRVGFTRIGMHQLKITIL